MKIIARCHPKLEPLLPKPFPAKAGLPEWLKSMPSKVVSETLGGQDVRTLKQCLPFIEAMSEGILIPLPTDLHIKGGELSWNWDPPILDDASISRSPLGVHVPEQGTGAPLNDHGALILKFMNFWTLEVPEGWNLLFTHPVNRTELPFETLSGLVNCHVFKDGYVHFPALLAPGFEGTIATGTPVAQVIPIPASAPELEIKAMTKPEIEANRQMQEALQNETGVYRKSTKA